MNNNKELLCNFVADLDMFIISTKFKHRGNHNITWMQPETNNGNQIDHILVAKGNCKAVSDVRSYWRANIVSDNLVGTKLKVNKTGVK